MFWPMSHFAIPFVRRIESWMARAALAAALVPALAAAGQLPDGFVYLRDVDPGIAQDMRYAGANNFTGAALPGYGAPECVLRREAADALAKVQADLGAQNLGLKVYDCYRPERAVREFERWSREPEPLGQPTKRFYPRYEKLQLFPLGYIATHSAHSAGIAVDLTLVQRDAPAAPAYDAKASYGACTAPAAQRAPDDSLDMGTGFDCFDEKSRTQSGGLTDEQKHDRAILVAAMRAHGFQNYFREWWHFSYGTQGARHYDFAIAPR